MKYRSAGAGYQFKAEITSGFSHPSLLLNIFSNLGDHLPDFFQYGYDVGKRQALSISQPFG